uniref:Uncharacterized protein n=1 Tax=Anguilla anguilla TaxID=7936 RepID=A0A0E9VJH6_ANGAN
MFARGFPVGTLVSSCNPMTKQVRLLGWTSQGIAVKQHAQQANLPCINEG